MAITISIALQKGGVGKSTTAQALASTLGFRGNNVLLIDLDSQCNLTYATGIDHKNKTIFDLMAGDCELNDTTISCKYYALIPSDSRMTNIEMAEGVSPYLLKSVLKSAQEKYDYIIIDTPPALGNLNYNALVASDYVVIPTEPKPFALQGLGALNKTIKSIQKKANPNLQVLGILLVKYSNRTVLNRSIKGMIEDFATEMDTTVFETTIREGIAVAEAQAMQQDLIDYAKSSKPNIDYKAFTTELIKRIGVIK